MKKTVILLTAALFLSGSLWADDSFFTSGFGDSESEDSATGDFSFGDSDFGDGGFETADSVKRVGPLKSAAV